MLLLPLVLLASLCVARVGVIVALGIVPKSVEVQVGFQLCIGSIGCVREEASYRGQWRFKYDSNCVTVQLDGFQGGVRDEALCRDQWRFEWDSTFVVVQLGGLFRDVCGCMILFVVVLQCNVSLGMPVVPVFLYGEDGTGTMCFKRQLRLCSYTTRLVRRLCQLRQSRVLA